MASRGLLVPTSYLPYIFNTAAAVSVVPIVAGTVCLLKPDSGYKALNFFTPTAGRDERLSNGLLRMYAVRQVSLGLSTLAMWWTGSPRALGWSSLGGTLVAVIDGLVAKEVSGEHVAGHWVGVGLSLFFSSTLLGLL